MIEETDQIISRRGFLRRIWRYLTVVVAGQGAYLGLSFLASRNSENNTGQIVTAGLVTDFQPGTITASDANRYFLIRFPDGSFLALHSKCTHLACIVGWESDKHVFACPCHGSLFNQDGSIINPPAPRPLDYFPVSIDDGGRILVDTRKPIARTAVTGNELVYAPIQAVQPTAASTVAK